jgi:hypothetical protein
VNDLSDYSSWEFLLDGDAQDFRSLSEKPGTSYFNIYGGIDHWNDCRNDDFRMTTIYCEGESDPAVIWQIGYELLSFFNGASALFRYGYQKASINTILYDGKQLDYVAPMPVRALLGPASISRHQINEQIKKSAKSSPRFPLLHLATENEDVSIILKYLDMEHGWVTYYKLLEAVEGFAKAKGVNLGIDKSARTAFTNTANNSSLSGFDSRHGFKEVVKENKTKAMSLHEAHEFIFGVIKSFLTKANFK